MGVPQPLTRLAAADGLDPATLDFAKAADQKDPLASLRDQYHLPLKVAAEHSAWPEGRPAPEPSSSEPALYLCGNSLGPMPKRTRQYIVEDLDAWGTHGVLGHFNHPKGPTRQWTKMEEVPSRIASDIVGAKPSEVTLCNTLTGNLNSALATFYRPLSLPHSLLGQPGGKRRHKIIHERGPFPSDQYALASAVRLNNGDPEESLVPLTPREGEDTLRTEDILAVLEREAATGECWGILLGSVQYLTGQHFELGKIAKRAQELGILVGYDLAHAFANVPLALHDWGVDFAVWCTYKYGSSGAGGIGGLFVHEKWHQHELVRPSGWWGHNKATRFAMPKVFDPMPGAAGWQVSNPSNFDIVSLRGSLETLATALDLSAPAQRAAETSRYASAEWQEERERQTTIAFGSLMPVLRAKSEQLTGYLEYLLFEVPANRSVFEQVGMTLVTPADPAQRGSQLTLRVPNTSASEKRPKTDAPGPGTASSAASKDGSVPPPIAKETAVARLHTYAEEKFGLIADIRNPDVIRLAPLAQYSTFQDVWQSVAALRESVQAVLL
ncbi:unnamed protein product [Parajaminaea phylloscopi]